MSHSSYGLLTRRASAVIISALVAAACSKDPDVVKREHLKSGDEYVAKKQYNEAIIEYRTAVQTDPRFGEARYKLGLAYTHLKDPKALKNAYAEFVRAADLMPDDADAQLQAGKFLLMAGKYEDAQARAQQVLKVNSKNPDAQILLGNAMAGMKDMDGAISHIKEGIEQRPTEVFAYENLALAHLARGEKERAEEAFADAVRIAPNSAQAHLAMANYQWATNKLEDAEKELQRARELEPRSPVVNQALTTFMLRNGRAAEAEPFMKAFVEASDDPSAQLALADYYISVKRYDDARPVLERAVAATETFASASVSLAMLDYSTDHRQEAHRRIDGVLAAQARNAPALVAKGRFLAAEGKTSDALASAKAAVAADADSPAAQFFLADMLFSSKSFDEAITVYNEVLRLSPGHPPTQLQLSRLYLAKGDVAASVELSGRIVKVEPTLLWGHVLLARGLMAQRHQDQAQVEMKKLSAMAPEWAETHNVWAAFYLSSGNTKQARASFTRAQELDPKSSEAVKGLVGLDIQEGQLESAMARIDLRLKNSPDDTQWLLYPSVVYGKAKNPAKAEAVLRHVIELEPSNLQAYSALAQIHITQRRTEEARAELDAIARQQPKAVGVATMAAMLLETENKPDEAKQRYEKIVAAEPRAAVAANNLAWLYASGGGNLDTALQLAQTAKAQIPNTPEVIDTLGYIYYKKGLSTLAISTLKESVDKQPANPTFSYHLGLAYAQNGENSRAREAISKALSSNTTFPEAADAKKALAGL